MVKKLLLPMLITALVVVVVLKTVNLNQLVKVLEGLSWRTIGFLAGLSVGIELLKSLRFYLLLRNRQVQISYGRTIVIFMAGESVVMLPGGEGMRLVLLKKQANAAVTATIGPIVAQALYDFVVAAVIVSVGAIGLPALRWSAVIIDGVLALAMGILLNPAIFTKALDGLAWLSYIKQHRPEISQARHELGSLLLAKQPGYAPSWVAVWGGLLTVLVMLLGGWQLQRMISLSGYEVALPLAVLLYASSVLVVAIGGIVPAGVGVTDGGMVGLLYVLGGLSYQAGIAVVLLYRLFTLVLITAIGGIFMLSLYLGRFKFLFDRNTSV